MTPLVFVGVVVAGGAGAGARLVVDAAVRAGLSSPLPWGTAFLNVSGSFLLGLVGGLVATAALPPEARSVIGTGFLGGYTTFSTAALDAARLARQGRRWAATTMIFGVFVVAVVAAGLGWWAGSFAP